MGGGRERISRLAHNAVTGVVSSLIGVVSPARACGYVRSRELLLAYKAASRRGPDRKWRGDIRSADAVLLRDWKQITARARELEQSNPYVSGAIDRICNNVIGQGIHPQAQLKTASGAADKIRNSAIEAAWWRWAEAPEIGYREKQELALRHLWVDGELLVHTYLDYDLLRRGIVPLRMELIEADHLDVSVHGDLRNGNTARRGIEFDSKGDPVAYHIYDEHPYNETLTKLFISRRIPADQVIHVFRRRRISQTRGVSWLASVIMRLRGLDEYEDSERIAARLTSAFAFFLESPIPEFGPEALGGQLPGYGESAALAASGLRVPDFVDPGRIQQLPPGSKITAEGFQRPGEQFKPFVATNLRGNSVGMGMSYEAFSNDYTDASYSSARSAALEERRGYRAQQIVLNERLNSPLWAMWTRALTLSGLVPGVGPEVPVYWQTPGWPWIDPARDAQAAKQELDLGITNRRKLCADRGLDFDENLEELARENDLLRQHGLLEVENA